MSIGLRFSVRGSTGLGLEPGLGLCYSRRHAASKSPPADCNTVETEESAMVSPGSLPRTLTIKLKCVDWGMCMYTYRGVT